MIKDLISLENCVILDSVKDWKEAVHVSVDLLVKAGACTKEYEDAVIKVTEEYGPYYVLTDHMALIHASGNDDIVHKTMLSCALLKEPVAFSEEKNDVRVLIGLCAADSTAHMTGMVAISSIFGDSDNEQKFLEATSAEEIYNLFISHADAQ